MLFVLLGLVRESSNLEKGNGNLIGEPLRGHEDWASSVIVSIDGQTVVSGSDNTVW